MPYAFNCIRQRKGPKFIIALFPPLKDEMKHHRSGRIEHGLNRPFNCINNLIRAVGTYNALIRISTIRPARVFQYERSTLGRVEQGFV
jgi:hypothetical protein